MSFDTIWLILGGVMLISIIIIFLLSKGADRIVNLICLLTIPACVGVAWLVQLAMIRFL